MDNTEMSVRAIGGPTAVLEIGGLRLVTDPTFDEPRDYPLGAGHALSKTAGPAIRAAEVGPADAIVRGASGRAAGNSDDARDTSPFAAAGSCATITRSA